MSVLVTGGAGFIGSHLIKKLVEDGVSVTSIDIRDPQVGIEGATYVIGDVSEAENLEKLGSFEHIFHLAAQTSSIRSELDSKTDIMTNVIGTDEVCKFAVRRNSGFTFSSSMAVYGDGEVTTNSDLLPKSTYGITKLAAEHLIKKHSSLGHNFNILRLFNVYGIGQNLDDMQQGMLSIFVSMAIRDGLIVVKGTPDRTRDFVHVSDVVDHLIKTMNPSGNKKNLHEVKNIASGISTSVERLVGMISEIMLQKFGKEIVAQYQSGFKEDVGCITCMDPLKEVVMGLDDGLVEFINWSMEMINAHSIANR